MLLTITSFLRRTALKMSRNPEDLVKVFEIFAQFLKNKSNFENPSLTTVEKGAKSGSKEMPLALSPEIAKKLETMLKSPEHDKKFHTVYDTGVAHDPKNVTGKDVNFLYILGQFLTVITTILDSLAFQVQRAKEKNKDLKIDQNDFDKAPHIFNSIWGNEPLATSARGLTHLYDARKHFKPDEEIPPDYVKKHTKTVIDDLLTRINKSIDFVNNTLKSLNDQAKDIPE